MNKLCNVQILELYKNINTYVIRFNSILLYSSY